MTNFRFLTASALASATMVLLPATAMAQTQPDATQTAEAEDTTGTVITVTGSRIIRPNIESSAPITTVTGEELFETGQVSVGDILNDLPQLRNTFSQQNSTRFLGTRGLNLLDLRGLGTSRTLVLQNGRRHVAGDILSTGTSVDVNTIPTDLIERIDIRTGGNSAVYGSDAIAGVVNFILKDNFEGLQLRGQAGISKYEDAGNQYISLLAGKNFAEDRGNIAINVEFAHQSDFYAAARPSLRQNNGFVVVDTDVGASSDAVPDRLFFRDIRSSTISLGGYTAVLQGSGATGAACGRDSVGNPFSCVQQFQSDGTLVPVTGLRVGLGPNGNFIGGNGYTGREGRLLALSPDLERISVNVLGHYDFSDAASFFVEAKYVRTVAFGSQSGPFFFQGTTLGDIAPVNRERPRLDNPYLSPQARAALTAQLLATEVNANTGAALSATALANQRAAINAGTFRFNLRRNFLDAGIRDERITRETYRIVGGLRGDFNDDWRYEVSVNYGEFREKNVITGNVNIQRFLLGVDAVRDPATGQIVCRSRLDPASAGEDYAGNPAVLAQDIAACVPINPFGEGNLSPEARAYITVPSRANGKITQFVANGFLSGDMSQLFELPGGPIGFSVGGEYRRETNAYDLDDLTQQGYAFYNAIPEFTAPSFEVKEVFGEVLIPILKDTPFFQELTVSGSGRISDYKGATGTVYAYGGDITWKPIEDITFRGTYSRSVRAPNLGELFSSQSQNFAPAPNDPCSARNLNTGSATRAANCAAAGRPANYDFVYTSSLEIISGGNPDLREETSDSYTIGGVLTPRFAPGLSISVDYYDITVDNVITSVSAQQILNNCYDAVDLNNQFCSLFTRAGPGGGPRGEQEFRVLEGSLLQSTLNFAKFKARGIDTNVNYRRTFGWGTLNLAGIWTRQLQRDNFTNPSDPGRANRLLLELADPKDQVNVNASAKIGNFTFGYQFRWISRQVLNTYEDFFELQGRAPENPDYADRRYYPEVFYHDVRFDLEVDKRFNIYLGIDNLTNRMPPLGLTGVGAGSGIFDNRGRYFYTGVVAKF